MSHPYYAARSGRTYRHSKLAAVTGPGSKSVSLAVDHFGLFGMPPHSLNIARILGGALMSVGIVLIASF